MGMKRKQQGFLGGALVLLLAVAIVKGIGALFKIPLNAVIGDVGMGYFGTAYTLYNPVFSLATAGFPVAISRTASEWLARKRYRDVRRLHALSVPIFLLLGALACAFMLLAAPPFLSFINRGDQNALAAVYTLAPAVFFGSLSAVYRGYYEGLGDMRPTAFSEVAEAVCKLVIGLSASCFVMHRAMEEYGAAGTVFGSPVTSEEYARSAALPWAAAAALLGVTVGSVISFLVLWLTYRLRGDGITREQLARAPAPARRKTIVAALVRTAVPVALGALAVNLSSLVDTAFLQNRMNALMQTDAEALLSQYGSFLRPEDIAQGRVPTALFGCYTNALTLFTIVPAMTQAFGISALPSVTAAWAGGSRVKLEHSVENVLRISALVTMPAGLVLSVLADPIARLLGYNPISGRILVLLGLGAVFAAVNVPINSMLQAVGRIDLPVKLLCTGLVIKVGLNYALTGIPEINVMGAGMGTLVCYFFLAFFGLAALGRETGLHMRLFRLFGKPLLCACLAAAAGWQTAALVHRLCPGRLEALPAMAVFLLVYAACVLFFRVLRRSDINALPGGEKIAKILEKHRWIG